MNKTPLKEQIYEVKGMHCASCEILIEKRLLEIPGVKSVDASTAKSEVVIEYEGKKILFEELNKILEKEHYVFTDKKSGQGHNFNVREFFMIFGTGLLIIAGFLALNRLGLAGLINVNAKSSLPMFFVFGLIAGISTCAALVGGIILSMSKQWLGLYAHSDSLTKKIQPHLMFNIGRLISYTVFGAVLGAIGKKLQISLQISSYLVIAVSIIMFFLALQMLGLRIFRRLQITTPKFITRYIANESKFKGKYMPFLMGFLTFFLPCGFTITAESLALISGSAVQGLLIMLAFVLGTLPTLLFLGFSSVKFSQKPHLSNKFLKIAGILVLFFAFFNINNQLNVLGAPSLSDLNKNSIQVVNNNQNDSSLIDGKQVLKMEASSSGYQPSYFKVKAGIPVRWEIVDKGTSGCTNAVISKDLFDGAIPLTPGQTSIKEFTPEKPGKYKFSCWMGMISGIIEVVDRNTSSSLDAVPQSQNTDNVISPNAQGCGCGKAICGSGCGGNCGSCHSQ